MSIRINWYSWCGYVTRKEDFDSLVLYSNEWHTVYVWISIQFVQIEEDVQTRFCKYPLRSVPILSEEFLHEDVTKHQSEGTSLYYANISLTNLYRRFKRINLVVVFETS